MTDRKDTANPSAGRRGRAGRDAWTVSDDRTGPVFDPGAHVATVRQRPVQPGWKATSRPLGDAVLHAGETRVTRTFGDGVARQRMTEGG